MMNKTILVSKSGMLSPAKDCSVIKSDCIIKQKEKLPENKNADNGNQRKNDGEKKRR